MSKSMEIKRGKNNTQIGCHA